MIRHMVLLCFHDDIREQQLLLVRAALLGMNKIVEGILRVEWVGNDSQEGKKTLGISHAVLMTFRDKESRLGYLMHSEHDALRAVFHHQLRDILVLDYNVFPDSVAKY